MPHDLLNKVTLTPDSEKRTGFFLKIEELQLTTFLSLCSRLRPDYVLDVGANVGLYTLVTRKYFPELHFLCFEPSPDTFSELAKNVELNPDGTPIELFKVAASSAPGSIDFVDFDNLSGKNGILRTSIHESEGASVISVETKTMDSMLGFSGQNLLIKIDTEGHELEVLQGAAKLLADNSCTIQIETGHGELHGAIKGFAQHLGYRRIFSLGPDEYYSNLDILKEDRLCLAILEGAMTRLINFRWHGTFDFTPLPD